jgi:hypothetical protein
MTALSSRQKDGRPKNDEYYTPKYIFDALGLVFDLDPCSPQTGSNVPAKQIYSLPSDGFVLPWFGLVWMNPPFSETSKWANKFMDHGNGLALVPMTQAKWFDRVWQNVDAMMLLPIPFKFDRPDGLRKDIFMPVCLLSLGDTATTALRKSGIGRVR